MGLEDWKKNFQKQSKNEKVLILFLAFFAILALILFVIVLSNRSLNDHTCTTPSCINAANHILHSIDQTLDPCEDFYKFACGGLLKNTFFRTAPSLTHEMNDLVKHQINQLIMHDHDLDDDKLPKSYEMVRKFYKLCTNTTLIEEDKDKTFLEGLERILGGWPLANGYSIPFDWTDVTIKARREGIEPSASYDKNYFSEDKVDHYVKIASIMGRTVPGARAEMLKAMEFAKKLNHISEKSQNATRNSTLEQKKMTIGELQRTVQYVPIVSWVDFLRNITNIKNLTEQTVVIVDVTQEYFRELQLLISSTESKSRANYVAAVLLMYQYDFLTDDVRKIAQKIDSDSKPKERKVVCAEHIKHYFPGEVEGVYIRKLITKERKEDILKMLNNVKLKMELAVNRTAWVDDVSKNRLSEFLRNLTVGIGWTDDVYDVENFEKFWHYEKLHLDFDEPLFAVIHKLNNFRMDIRYSEVNRYWHRVQIEMKIPHLDANAYFMKFMNLLILTAPLLQHPMYDLHRPNYMNYGSLGSIIGHELTHAVTHTSAMDEEMKEYMNENYPQIWTNQTKENFENASQCAIEEYDNYESHTEFLNDLSGNETLEENVADFAGMNVAYEAYQSWVYENGHEKLLPGIDLTPNQIFWIMSANYFCLDEKLLKESACKDRKHGGNSFRTNGPVRNSPHFARDFGCPLESKMNPRDKCKIY